MTYTTSFYQKIIDPDGWIIPGIKLTNTGPFLWNGYEKVQFFTNLVPFLSEAVEASGCYFFENWLMKLKCPNLLKPIGTRDEFELEFSGSSEPKL
jgi:hypothetical protein